jgi:hypothetical protein
MGKKNAEFSRFDGGQLGEEDVVMQSGNGSAGVGAVLVHFSAKDLVVDWDKVHDLEFVRKLSVPKAVMKI